MGGIDIDEIRFGLLLDFESTQANSFASPPVSMVEFMDVAIHWPLVEERFLDGVFGKDANSWASHTTRI